MPDAITPEKLAELRKLAENATPGEWEPSEVLAWANEREYSDTATFRFEVRAHTLRHIAAFDPPTAIALLDRIESLQARLDAWMAEADKWKDDCFDVARQRNELREHIDDALARHVPHECDLLHCLIAHGGRCMRTGTCAECGHPMPCSTRRTLDPSLGGAK